MKCKYCHKTVKSIAHFMQAHKALMLRKMHRGRGKRGKRAHGGKRRSGGQKSSTVGTGGYSKLTLTFHD